SSGSPKRPTCPRSVRPRTSPGSRPHAAELPGEREDVMFELTGKNALITGATGPIGTSIARVLHAQGAAVAISGTRREVLDRLAADLGGGRVHVLPCNLADSAETEALVPRVEEAMGQLDVLVANAGVTKDNL